MVDWNQNAHNVEAHRAAACRIQEPTATHRCTVSEALCFFFAVRKYPTYLTAKHGCKFKDGGRLKRESAKVPGQRHAELHNCTPSHKFVWDTLCLPVESLLHRRVRKGLTMSVSYCHTGVIVWVFYLTFSQSQNPSWLSPVPCPVGKQCLYPLRTLQMGACKQTEIFWGINCPWLSVSSKGQFICFISWYFLACQYTHAFCDIEFTVLKSNYLFVLECHQTEITWN